jgi:hypothetical protein
VGVGKPETFDFLNCFTHFCWKTKIGRFWLRRKTITKRMLAKRKAQTWSRSAAGGGTSRYRCNGSAASCEVNSTRLLRHGRQHRRRGNLRVATASSRAAPFPAQRFAVPPEAGASAVILHAGICAGAARKAGPTAND